MIFLKTRNNYIFKQWGTASIAKIDKVYYLQATLKGLGVTTLYEGEEKPRFRHLGLICILGYILSIPFYMFVALFLCFYFIGRSVHLLAKALLILSYVLMQMPNSAKFEFKELFEIWGKDN